MWDIQTQRDKKVGPPSTHPRDPDGTKGEAASQVKWAAEAEAGPWHTEAEQTKLYFVPRHLSSWEEQEPEIFLRLEVTFKHLA